MENEQKTEKPKKVLYGIVATLVAATIAYRILILNNFEQSTLLFVGLPALITVLVIKFTGTPKSAYGITFKTMTIFLLMSGILLGEGIVCILMAAPLFYGVAAIVIFVSNIFGKNNKGKLHTLVIIPVLLIGSELIFTNDVPKLNVVTVSRTFKEDVSLNNLNGSPEFMKNIPVFFELGFPKPISIQGTGLQKNDFRKIQFESSTKGIGTLHLVVKELAKDKVIFRMISDDTHINHWLSWDEMEIVLSSNQNGEKIVTWTTSYRCSLSPSWYFEPLQRFAVYTSSNHLIDSYFNQD